MLSFAFFSTRILASAILGKTAPGGRRRRLDLPRSPRSPVIDLPRRRRRRLRPPGTDRYRLAGRGRIPHSLPLCLQAIIQIRQYDVRAHSSLSTANTVSPKGDDDAVFSRQEAQQYYVVTSTLHPRCCRVGRFIYRQRCRSGNYCPASASSCAVTHVCDRHATNK